MNELTPGIEAELRAAINPAYRDQRGTESWERAILLGEIDRLRAAIAEQVEPLETVPWPQVVAYPGRGHPDGLSAWLDVRLDHGPETTRFVRQPQAEQPAQALTDEFIDATYKRFGTGRPDGFAAAAREIERAALASAPRVPRHIAVAAQAVRKQLAEPFPRDELDLDAVRMLADALAAPQPEGGA